MATNNQHNVTLSGQSGTGSHAGTTSALLVTPKIGTINDTNDVTALVLNPTASAINYNQLVSSATGVPVEWAAQGSNANIGMYARTKGTGSFSIISSATTIPFILFNGTNAQHSTNFSFSNTANTRTVTFPDADGTVLFSTGSGGLKSFQIFTSGTAATYTRPAGITSILVECLGGGGGGGGVDAVASSIGAAGGGAGGSYCRKWYVSAASSYTYTVGGGGPGGTAGANNGTVGTSTTFDTMTATGGNGGVGVLAINASCVVALGGAAQVATGGDFNTSGFCGHMGVAGLGSSASGAGGSSIYGGGSVGIYNATLTTSTAGANGTTYGGGGSGAVSFTGTVDRAGGNGSAGIIIVWEFS